MRDDDADEEHVTAIDANTSAVRRFAALRSSVVCLVVST